MPWTQEKLAQIPEVYRDFMLMLKPVIDSRHSVLRITGIPFSTIYVGLAEKYEYNHDAVQVLADNLRKEGYIVEDMGIFYQPTGKGEQLIQAISGTDHRSTNLVPPLPSL